MVTTFPTHEVLEQNLLRTEDPKLLRLTSVSHMFESNLGCLKFIFKDGGVSPKFGSYEGNKVCNLHRADIAKITVIYNNAKLIGLMFTYRNGEEAP